MGRKCHAVAALAVAFAAAAALAVAADRGLSLVGAAVAPEEDMGLLRKLANLMWKSDGKTYQHVWPPMEFGWQIVLGTLIGFFGAAFGSVGGVGGGGIFVPMLTLIIGFDPKSSTAISKCMIMGASVSTVYYNLRLKHPTLDMPVIDYDLAVLIQPMLMLGISIGVIFNVLFPDWLVTVLLIILFLGTSTKAFLKGIETWKKETLIQREAAKRLEQTAGQEAEYAPLPTGPGAAAGTKALSSDEATSIIKNIHWKELGLLSFVWVAFLVLQVTKNYTATCSPWYWVLNLLQVPVSVGVTLYEGFGLMSGKRVLSSCDDGYGLPGHKASGLAQTPLAEKRVFPVRLGKFKNVGTQGPVEGGNANANANANASVLSRDQGESSSSSLDGRRCFSMGTYQYVLGTSELRVALQPGRNRNGAGGAIRGRPPGLSSINADIMEGKRICARNKGESFSVSKIWQWSNLKGKLPAGSDECSDTGSLPWMKRGGAADTSNI